MKTVAILGLGSRGQNYGKHLFKKEGVEIVAICDKLQPKIDKFSKIWNIPQDKCFTSDEEFFAKGKMADVLLVTTQDKDHYGHAVKALNLGYHLLLEKPVSPVIEETLEIERLAREKNRKVLVCHVLRYAPYYKKVKEIISSGMLGDIMTIEHSEHIAYWHFTHSYVRGLWRKESETSPMLLAKCCHDMDLLYWFCDSKAKKLNSFGELRFFRKENAPAGCADNCFDCKYRKECLYDAEKLYVGEKTAFGRKKKVFQWSPTAFSLSKDKDDVLNALKNDPKGKLWARCVYRCDNDVCDSQTINMDMQNGIKISVTVDAFNSKDHRHTEIRGTKGELYADDSGSVLYLHLFGKKPKKIIVNIIPVIKGHFGGDQGVINAIMNFDIDTNEQSSDYSWIKDTVESHRIVAAAELSRKEGGRVVSLSEIPDIAD